MAEIPPVLISFAVSGIQSVDKAFDSIETRIIRLEQASTRAAESGSRARVRTAEGEAESRGRSATKGAAAATKAEAEATREVERLEKYKWQVRIRSSEMAGREAAKLAKQEMREAELAAREVERLEEYKMRVRIRSSEMAGRAVAAEARAEEAARNRVARGIGSAATRGVGRALGGAASMAGSALAIGGGFAIADIAGKELSAERQAALIVNEVTVGGKVPEGATVANILGHSSQVSRETGMAKGEVESGMLAYTRAAKGGDFDTALKSMPFFAKLAKTTGSDITDIAKGAGLLQSQNPKLKSPELQQMLIDMMEQGHQGNKSLSEMVGLAGVVGSARGAYGGDMAGNQRKLLGLTQLAAPEAGSAEEAARGIKQMSLQVEKPKNVKMLEKWGVKYNEHGQVGDVEQMIESVLSGTGGNLQQIGRVFETRSGGLMRHMANTFNEAGGGEKGLSAARAEMATVTKATGTPESLEEQFQKLMSTPAEKLSKALNEISEIVSMRLEPILARLSDRLEAGEPAIKNLMNSMLDMADWLIANPWKGLGAAVTLAVTKELGSAALGAATTKAITGAIGGQFAAGLSIIGATIAITEVGVLLIDLLGSIETKRQQQNVSDTNAAANLASQVGGDVRQGKVTPQDVSDIQKKISEMEVKKREQEKAVASGPQVYDWKLGGFLGPLLARSDNEANARAELKQTETTLQLLNRALDAATKKINAHGDALDKHPPPLDPARHQPISSPGRS